MVYVDIPIGTDCALLLTDLAMHAKESDFIQGLLRNKKYRPYIYFHLLYIDNGLSMNNTRYGDY